MKRFLIVVLVFLIGLGTTVSAYEYSTEFWQWNTNYVNALESENDTDIIDYGEKQIAYLENVMNPEDINMLRTRLVNVGNAYARQGNYDAAAATFGKYVTYSDANDYTDTDWDGLRVAKAKELQYASQIRIFTDGGEGCFYGSKNEHQNGVLYGASSDGAIRKQLDHESMVLLFQELGDSVNDWSKLIFDQAREKGLVVEFALNCPNQREDIYNIYHFAESLRTISEFIGNYEDVPVLLRFGAEFNEWSEPEDGNAFIEAFRYVSDYFKSRNSNVAMVWSPLQEGRWEIQLKDFYPGDEYVDWIGISAYSNIYHMGNPYTELDYQIVYKAGDNADPVLAVKEIIETFGNDKPVLIAESGFCKKCDTTNQDTPTWAQKRMKEFYSYLPMVYPQVKGISHFDKYYEGEPHDYSLTGGIKETYLKMIENPRMIQRGCENSYTYRELTDGSQINSMTGVYTYAHIYGETTKKVTYYIDGQWAGESTQMPFGMYLEFGKGAKQLCVVAEGEKGKVIKKTFSLNASPWSSSDIHVTVNGDRVHFDQPPIIYNDRTLVPLRAIFEAMGAEVFWDGGTRTVTGRKGDRLVELSIGSNVMYVNQQKMFLDVPSIQVNGRTLVPARAVAEGLGATIEWLGESSTVKIIE